MTDVSSFQAGRRPSVSRGALVVCGVLAALVVGAARAAEPSFVPGPGSPIAVGTNPHSIATADLNRDGELDLAVANFGSNNVSILLGDGAGGFTAATPVAVGTGPLGLAVADLNRDGKPDLAVANSGSDTVSILFGDGAGGFTAASQVPVPNAPWYVAVGRLNGDGRPDLAVSHTGVSPTGVAATELSILLGDGAGGFTHAAGSPITVGRVPYGVAIADLNRDGKADIAVANQFSGTVSILLGNGDGTFAAAPGSPVPVGSGPSWVAVSDLNGDGRLDLAVSNQGSDNVSILLGDGAGGVTGAPGSPVPAGNGPTPLVTADFNLDGAPDLATGNIVADTVSLLVGDGNAAFSNAATLTVGDMPFSLTSGDFNGDGKPDLAVANYGSNNVSVLLNSTPTALELIDALHAEVKAADLKQGLGSKLRKDLREAEKALERRPPRTAVACAALDAFIAKLEDNVGTRGLTPEQAADWTAQANEIKEAAGC